MIENACLIASPWGSDIVDPPGETPATPELTRTRVTLLRGADAVTTCGRTFARVVADFAGIDPCNVDVLPFGVDVEAFQPIEPPMRTASGPYRVGFFKGFREVYGPTYLIQAIPLVLAQIPNTRFEMVGDGAQLVLCQQMASKLGVNSSMDWIPRQPHRELPKLMARWDVTVIPSVQEAFGVAALESSAMAVPVVASDVGGLRDTVRDGRTGVLVPPRSPEALADALIMILQNADLRRRMGRAGRERVQSDYDWRDLYDRWIKFYERARARVAQPPPAGPQGTAEGRCATKNPEPESLAAAEH
jgi:glycosyltransferase involved in cell wall biosynthesis